MCRYTTSSVEQRYFDWLVNKVGVFRNDLPYGLLLEELYATSFVYIVRDDYNRWVDGVELRNQFYDETGEYEVMDETGCSVLEMLIAMAQREEEEVLTDDVTEWTKVLFWTMMENLGLIAFDDQNYDQNTVYKILIAWMYRTYSDDGQGSIFHRSPGRRINYKRQPFWMQMSWYVNDNLI